ncbi:MAG: PKD domain-containing protein, partial [Flavobacteriales bacterium]|nr:PKD domain-containing protein [Flavobacteriales bacterium]
TDFSTYLAIDPDNVITGYSWDFGGLGSSSLPNPTFDFPSPGNHLVTLTVTTDGGCTATYSQNVFVDSVGVPVITIAPGPTCVGDVIDFSATAAGATNYTWTFGDGSGFVGQDASRNYDADNIYTVTVVATNDAGCENTASTTITIFPGIPDADITGDEVICDGSLATLTAPAGYSYLWSNSMTTSSIMVGAGTYSVTLTDGNGCMRELDPFTVTEVPFPDATISGTPYICDDGCVTLSVPFQVGYTYKWFDGSMNDMGVFGPSITVCDFNLNGPYMASVTNLYGCESTSDPYDVQVVASPSFSVTVSPDGCEGTLNTLEITPVQPDVDYSWSTGETGTLITTSAAGTYTAYGVDQNTGCTSSAVGVVNPLPNLCYLIEGCYEACDSTEICGPSGLDYYQWNLDGNPLPGENMNCIEVTASGNYTLTAQNEFGCETTSGSIIIDIIDCDDPCENVDLLSEPAIINNIPDPCCFTLSYDLNFSGLQGLHIHTDDADFSYDPGAIDPALDFLGGTTGSVQLIGDMGAPLPTGALNDFITICLTDVTNDPQQVIIDWYDFDNMVVCSDTLEFHCPVEPDCMYLTEQDIYCEDGQTVYEFTVCNPNDADFSVGYFNFDNISPASLVATPSTFTPSPAIAPGECRSFSTILSGPGIGGDQFCFNIIAHEFDPAVVDSTLCCSLDTLYCIDIPNCDPCTDVGVLDVHMSDPDDCCTEITLENNYTPGFFDEIMICSVSPSNTVTVNNYIGSGWLTSGYDGTSFSLIPTSMFGNVVPNGTFTLPEICVQAGEAPPQLIAIKWMRDGEVVCEDIIENFCNPDCGYLLDNEIECTDTGWFYSGTLFNTAGYTVSEAHVTFNDPTFAAYNQVFSLGSVPAGGSFGPL